MITIEHLAGSIRTDFLGVINTTVNYAYVFIKRKLEVVVEFLSDESVKSRLMADARWVEERHQIGARQDGASYTWNRALETAAFLRRLGTAGDGVAFLDKLRQASFVRTCPRNVMCFCVCVHVYFSSQHRTYWRACRGLEVDASHVCQMSIAFLDDLSVFDFLCRHRKRRHLRHKTVS